MKNNDQLASLKKIFKSGAEAHAYLFSGGERNERKNAALELAAIATGHEGTGIQNPDVLLIELEEGEENISIEKARKVREFFSLGAHFGGKKVAIIDAFERLGTAAASTLLKIIEEPPKNAVIIIVSDHPAAILTAILSRVQKVRFLGEKEVGEDIDKRKEMFYTLREIITAHDAQRFALVEKISKGDDDVFPAWTSFFRDCAYVLAEGCDAFLENAWYASEIQDIVEKRNYSLVRVCAIIDELVHWGYIAKTTNANKRLIMENIALLF